MDPQLRKLLEVSYEAWMDSGISHAALRGSDKVTSGSPPAQKPSSLKGHFLEAYSGFTTVHYRETCMKWPS